VVISYYISVSILKTQIPNGAFEYRIGGAGGGIPGVGTVADRGVLD
jgi:hypothetical protein